jgi:hypothetical protein
VYSQEHVQKKLAMQLRFAEYRRLELIDQLTAMLEALDGRPARRNPYRGFPIQQMERLIQAGLDQIEERFIKKIWKRVSKSR